MGLRVFRVLRLSIRVKCSDSRFKIQNSRFEVKGLWFMVYVQRADFYREGILRVSDKELIDIGIS